MIKKILVTGTAGFIGFHLTKKLLDSGYEVAGLDSINDYYSVQVKYDRLKELGINKEGISYGKKAEGNGGLAFYQLNLEDKDGIFKLFEENKFDAVVNLAAQAGVRYSLVNPYAYIQSNITGFLNILEACRKYPVEHLVYASSSSVYGLNEKMPFSVEDNVDHPVSLYAASKKSNELMAHTYSYLYKIPTTGLRFFTVYGPWGRPDMALFIFTKNILEGNPIEVFNNGHMQRDFTYVADIVESIKRLVPLAPQGNKDFSGLYPDPSSSPAPYRVFNIGNNSPVKLMDFITNIEEQLGVKAKIEYKPLQMGDVPSTYADVTSLFETIDFKPQTTVTEGIRNFVSWYRDYFGY
jgi:UDP-glucuronate 4-epimerase